MVILKTPDQVMPAIEPDAPVAAAAASPFVIPRAPAYAARLLKHRRGGFHPFQVHLTFGDHWHFASSAKRLEDKTLADCPEIDPYGDDWVARCGYPYLALRPGEYARGAIDWRCLVNVRVLIDDQGDAGAGAADSDFFWMVGEIGRKAADVVFYGGYGCRSLAECAYLQRVINCGGAWPAWWSEEAEKQHGKKYAAWQAHAFRIIGERIGEP